jgi:hypothetical protein
MMHDTRTLPATCSACDLPEDKAGCPMIVDPRSLPQSQAQKLSKVLEDLKWKQCALVKACIALAFESVRGQPAHAKPAKTLGFDKTTGAAQ